MFSSVEVVRNEGGLTVHDLQRLGGGRGVSVNAIKLQTDGTFEKALVCFKDPEVWHAYLHFWTKKAAPHAFKFLG